MSDDRLLVGMVVRDRSGGVLRSTSLDFLDPNGRKLIAKTAWWAMHHGHHLTTWPLGYGETVREFDSRKTGAVVTP